MPHSDSTTFWHPSFNVYLPREVGLADPPSIFFLTSSGTELLRISGSGFYRSISFLSPSASKHWPQPRKIIHSSVLIFSSAITRLLRQGVQPALQCQYQKLLRVHSVQNSMHKKKPFNSLTPRTAPYICLLTVIFCYRIITVILFCLWHNPPDST